MDPISRRTTFTVLASILALAAVLTIGAFGAHAATPNLVVDGRVTYQTVDGFGVNFNSAAWNQGNAKVAIDSLISQQGSYQWRIIVEQASGWEETNDDADPFNFNWTYYNALYETPKFQALWNTLFYLRSKGVRGILSVMSYQPAWLGSPTIAKEDEWVEMIVSMLYYARHAKNLVIPPVSPLNEMDTGYPQGPKEDTAATLRLFQKLSARLNAVGMSDVQLVGPETAAMSAASAYTKALMTDSALMAKIRTFGYHDYAGASDSVNATIAASAFPDRHWFMTEYGAACSTCDGGGAGPSDEWAYSKKTLQNLLAHVGAGANGACVYDAMDSFYVHEGAESSWGQLSYDPATGAYTPRKRFWTLAQFNRWVRPGAVRIGITTNTTTAKIASFYQAASRTTSIVGINTGSAITLTGTITGISAPAFLAMYVTDSVRNYTRLADVPTSQGSFSVSIPADTVFTLTGVYIPDSVPPSAPTSLTAAAASYHQINLSWLAATDNIGVNSYQVFRNGAQIASIGAVKYSDLTVEPSTAYSYYVVAVDGNGNAGPPSNTVSITSPAPPPTLFLDAKVTTNQGTASTSITSPAVSTLLPNELILACLGSDGPSYAAVSFSSVSGGGLAWKLAKRMNTQRGTSEIWYAIAPSKLTGLVVTGARNSGSWGGTLTVLTYANADVVTLGATGGANAATGAATATVNTTKAGSLLVGVGNDWDHAVARTLPSDQTKLTEYFSPVGDTYWVQTTRVIANSATAVAVSTLAPTTDRWNLAVTEIRQK